ncbi:O-antigen ligase family protein [Aquimarina sp. SS2-1]|uniref:O-antigen ligase family protein n=1 Tax=Aquimarina besae TaxID=3342247 RepID=UPI00366CFBAE
MKSKDKILSILLLLFLTFCVQFTDVKVGLIKISELLLLGLAPFIFSKKIHKYVVYLLAFFTVTTLISLCVTYFSDFEHLGNSFLKQPYLITIGRYVELVTCLVLCNFVVLYFEVLKKKNTFHYYLLKFIDLNIIITVIFALVYVLVLIDVLSVNDTRLVYNYDIRLRGYFVEGGPFGLMLSFIFILTSFFKKSKKRDIKRLFLVVVILFMAQSKSGFLCTVLWIGIENYDFLRKKIKSFVYPLVIIGAIGFYFLFINIGSMYVREIGRVEQAVIIRPTDPNLIMGRISGVFIVPKIVANHPFFGIGTGNYPLLRNNKEYRGFFPLPPEEIRIKDAHGFGGLIDILVDNGFLGLLFFFFIIWHRYKTLKHRNHLKLLLVGFLMLFCFGVQIYFLYPWILFGLILTKENKIDAVSC